MFGSVFPGKFRSGGSQCVFAVSWVVRCVLGGSVSLLCATAALFPARAADSEKSSAAIPQFMQLPNVGWTGYIPGKPDYAHARTFAEWSPPLTGLGPITD